MYKWTATKDSIDNNNIKNKNNKDKNNNNNNIILPYIPLLNHIALHSIIFARFQFIRFIHQRYQHIKGIFLWCYKEVLETNNVEIYKYLIDNNQLETSRTPYTRFKNDRVDLRYGYNRGRWQDIVRKCSLPMFKLFFESMDRDAYNALRIHEQYYEIISKDQMDFLNQLNFKYSLSGVTLAYDAGNVEFAKWMFMNSRATLYGESMIKRALEVEDFEMVKFLTENAHINRVHSRLPYAIAQAARIGRLDIIRYFCENVHPDVPPPPLNIIHSSIEIAASNNYCNIVRYLNGKHPHPDLDKVCYMALNKGNVDVIRYLNDLYHNQLEMSWVHIIYILLTRNIEFIQYLKDIAHVKFHSESINPEEGINQFTDGSLKPKSNIPYLEMLEMLPPNLHEVFTVIELKRALINADFETIQIIAKKDIETFKRAVNIVAIRNSFTYHLLIGNNLECFKFIQPYIVVENHKLVFLYTVKKQFSDIIIAIMEEWNDIDYESLVQPFIIDSLYDRIKSHMQNQPMNIKKIIYSIINGLDDVFKYLVKMNNNQLPEPTVLNDALDVAIISGYLGIVRHINEQHNYIHCGDDVLDLLLDDYQLHHKMVNYIYPKLNVNRIFSSKSIDSLTAIYVDNIDLIICMHNQQQPFTEKAMDNACVTANFDALRFLHFNRTEGCTEMALESAIKNGYYHIAEFLLTNRTEGHSIKDYKKNPLVELLIQQYPYLEHNIKKLCKKKFLF